MEDIDLLKRLSVYSKYWKSNLTTVEDGDWIRTPLKYITEEHEVYNG